MNLKIKRDQQEVKNILSGRDKRFLVILGPCSAWPYEATVEYARRLKKLEPKVKNRLKLVMRVYIQKSRTNKKCWTGPLLEPDPFAAPDIKQGSDYAHNLISDIIKIGLPIAGEAVFINDIKEFVGLFSWVAIGARNTENHEHRVFASCIKPAVGMKNPLSGSIEIGIKSVAEVQRGYTKNNGNKYAHLVLRGGINGPNYFAEDILKAKTLLARHNVLNPAVLIDAGHDNCRVGGAKNHFRQVNVARKVMETLKKEPGLRQIVKGFMLESFLKPGSQKLEKLTAGTVDLGGLSITDPCIGWEETESLLLSFMAADEY